MPARPRSNGYGSLAEWSKALVSGTSHFDGVGSNPTTAIYAGRLQAGYRKTFDDFNIIFLINDVLDFNVHYYVFILVN